MSKVLGVGWAKTGTTTLGTCLTELGYDHRGQSFELVDDLLTTDRSRIRAVSDRHDSFEDWPWLLLFREFDSWHPGSRFVLTTRDPEPWLRSYRAQLDRSPAGPDWNRRRQILYGLPFPDVSDDMLVERYLRHNAEVQAYFQDRPDDLLVVDWTKGDGWDQLCAFLGRDVPDKPFPHANKATSTAPRGLRRLRAFLGGARH